MARSSGESGFERFNGLLLRHRGRTRLTQTQLAERVGVSLRTVQGWETGIMYPSTQRLQALIAALLTAGGMTAGRESEEANALWAAVERDSARVHPPFDRQWFAALLADRAVAQIPLTRPEPGSQPSPAVLSKPATELRSDWGDAPAVQDFVGRSAEIATLRRWVVDERCHLLGLYGMGGIGKTSVAAKLARDVAPEFTYSYWRGLRNAPLLVDWLKGAIRFLSVSSRHRLIPKRPN